MPTEKESIHKIKESNGGFCRPNIQRPFVWREERTECLLASIMSDYPIGILHVWRSKEPIGRRKFIDKSTRGVRQTGFYVPDDNKPKALAL